MCGIAGIITRRRLDEDVVRRLTDKIVHRGPDADGVWVDESVGLGLGQRRLAIVDLSPAGLQPMASSDGRWMVVFNGEIYNHVALRQELEAAGGGPGKVGADWRGHSDTETLVEAVAHWGLQQTLPRLVGMFAIAVWDRENRMLALVRDRFGEKPLYYGWAGGDFVFGSELKALRASAAFDNGIDRQALQFMLARTNVPAPFTIYEGLFKLEPGCLLLTSPDAALHVRRQPVAAGESDSGLFIERYWSYRDIVADGMKSAYKTEAEALSALEEALADSIRGQAMADVPIGAFLSGGIDSSTVVGLYQKYTPSRVRTFSIGFENGAFNEAEYAKVVARHFGTEHNELYVTIDQAQEVIPLLPSMYDEPFADPSQIPTHVVSRFARQQVTVAISGDGGDELFGGYDRYRVATDLWNKVRNIPKPIRATLGAAISSVPAPIWSALARTPGRPSVGVKLRRLGDRLRGATALEDLYESLFDEWAGERSPVLGEQSKFEMPRLDLPGAPDALRLMYMDAVSYLPDDILCKVDRAAMSVSLETRVPFLDHRVAAVAARTPLDMKMRGADGKIILRKLLYGMAPPEMFDRPKAGFGVPVGDWLRGPLRDWAEDLLEPSRMRQEGYLSPEIVQGRWKAFRDGRRNDVGGIWAILMFQAWLRNQRPS